MIYQWWIQQSPKMKKVGDFQRNILPQWKWTNTPIFGNCIFREIIAWDKQELYSFTQPESPQIINYGFMVQVVILESLWYNIS